MAALAMLATCGLTGFAAPPPAKTDAPKPLPEKIVTAWENAGAIVGWARVDEFGILRFILEKEGQPGDLATIRVIRWQEGLAKLPAPAVPFGLDISKTEVADAQLKELAELKSMQLLMLEFTQIRGAGLKELAGLKSLQTLDLSFSQVTDAGLKELAGLKSLQTLYLSACYQVTDAGLKQLNGLKCLRTLDLGGTKVTDVAVGDALERSLWFFLGRRHQFGLRRGALAQRFEVVPELLPFFPLRLRQLGEGVAWARR
jgi:hypothetical protein